MIIHLIDNIKIEGKVVTSDKFNNCHLIDVTINDQKKHENVYILG